MPLRIIAKKVKYLGKKYKKAVITVKEDGITFEGISVPITKEADIRLEEPTVKKAIKRAYLGSILIGLIALGIGWLGDIDSAFTFGAVILFIDVIIFLRTPIEDAIFPEKYLLIDTPYLLGKVEIRVEDESELRTLYEELLKIKHRKAKEA